MTGMTGGRRVALRPGPLRVVVVALLASTCIGVPLCLLVIAGLPFSHVDPLLPLREASGASATDARAVAGWLGQVALVIAWVAWAWTAACIVLEACSWRSGRPPVNLPGSRTMQWVVAVLMGTALSIGGAGRTAHPLQPIRPSAVRSVDRVLPAGDLVGRSSAPPVDVGGPAVRMHGGPSEAWSDAPSRPPRGDGHGLDDADIFDRAGGHGSAPSQAASMPALHTVSARETLWSIAELRLGSPRRWREIAELNYGRPQGDGGQLGDDHWIHPAWVLVLPASAPFVPDAPDAPDSVARSHTPHTPHTPHAPVAPVGAGVVGVGVSDLLDRLRRVQQRHRRLGGRIPLPDPVLGRFEQRLRSGDGADRMHSAEDAVARYFASRPDDRFPAPVLGVVVTGDEVELVIDDVGRSGVPPPGFTGAGGSSTIRIGRTSLRSTRERLGRSGRRPFPLPTLAAIGRSEDRLVLLNVEAVGSMAIDGETHDAEGVARALALELATSRWSGQFDLVLVGFGADLERFERVSVTGAAGPLLADLSWRRLRDTTVLGDRGFASATEARCRDGGTTWDPVVVICGPGVASADAAALVAGSGTGADGIAVIAVSGRAGHLGASRTICATPPGAAPVTDVFGSLLNPQQVSADDVDQVVRLVAVAEQAPEGEVDEEVDPADVGTAGTPAAGALAPRVPADGPGADGSGTGPVGRSPGPDPGPQAEHGVRTAGPDRVATGGRPGQVSALEVRGPGSAASVPAGSGPPEESLMPPVERSSAPVVDSAPTPAGGIGHPRYEVEVAVLGPVEIRGAARAFTRAWSIELVVYLAVHPTGAPNDIWSTALWPDRVMAPSSLHSTASVARRSLGKARDGSDHLPRSHGRLALGPSVGTDWDRFLALSEREDPAEWRAALELVRGRPFDGLRSTDWAILDGTAPSMESAIVDLSGRLAGACLRAGDPRGAEWSARRGLLVSPYDERLYRMLLRAADAAGNPGGVESVMTELVRVVADEIEPVESVHPSTLALYRSLSRRRVPTT